MNAVPLAVTLIVAVVALAIAIAVGALFVGGSLTQPPAAVSGATPARASVDLVDPAVRIELPTLELDG